MNNPRIPDYWTGNLYYVRLKTAYGYFYKIGFTTLPSVESRLGYSNSGDENYIDKVILFKSLNDAYMVEQRLHNALKSKKAFRRFSADENFPLCGNGQTELYLEDVLQLDADYKKAQSDETAANLKRKRLALQGKTEKDAVREDVLVKLFASVLFVIFIPFVLLFWLFLAVRNMEDFKEEFAGFLDRCTGGKKEKAAAEQALNENLEAILEGIGIRKRDTEA
jgi:hypothetical protein